MNLVWIPSPDPGDFQNSGDFLVQTYIFDKIFRKIQSVFASYCSKSNSLQLHLHLKSTLLLLCYFWRLNIGLIDWLKDMETQITTYQQKSAYTV